MSPAAPYFIVSSLLGRAEESGAKLCKLWGQRSGEEPGRQGDVSRSGQWTLLTWSTHFIGHYPCPVSASDAPTLVTRNYTSVIQGFICSTIKQ